MPLQVMVTGDSSRGAGRAGGAAQGELQGSSSCFQRKRSARAAGQPAPGTVPALAFSLGWSGSALLLLELCLLRDVSRCQHGVEFNTYLYFQSMAVAQQPVQMFWFACACREGACSPPELLPAPGAGATSPTP